MEHIQQGFCIFLNSLGVVNSWRANSKGEFCQAKVVQEQPQPPHELNEIQNRFNKKSEDVCCCESAQEPQQEALEETRLHWDLKLVRHRPTLLDGDSTKINKTKTVSLSITVCL